MPLYNLLVKDFDKKECQVYFHLNRETEELLTHNVAVIANSGKPQIQLETIDEITIPEILLKRGWKRNDGLYDTEILLYNRDHPESQLTRWC